ncbi:Crp/Fnr family transcriptional regulator [Maritalea sp. S77]|uniref:Crp/Fnr family transcriptional regulator n=1 Tax=Maritalea sp. S77 TaxID=3415125 RepID=UPI003C7E433A
MQKKAPKIDPSLVADFPLFLDMEKEAIADILEKGTAKHYKKGDHFFDQFEPATHFFLMLDGYLEVSKTTEDGSQVIMRHFGVGEIFGVAPAIAQKHYPATSRALVDCVAILWDNKCWDTFLVEQPRFIQNAYKSIGERLAQSQERIVEMSTEQVERRVAHAVMRLTHQCGVKTEQGILIDFPVSRQDIAEMTGTTLHTVSRLFSAWSGKGLMQVGRQKIEVLEAHKLALLAQGH